MNRPLHSITVTNSSFHDNVADLELCDTCGGGAMCVGVLGKGLRVSGSSFIGNKAPMGGALYLTKAGKAMVETVSE